MKEIVQDGAPALRKIAALVPELSFGSKELVKLLVEMTDALEAQPEGVALAAPQVGVSWRLFIVRVDRTTPVLPTLEISSSSKRAPEVDVYINPEIVKTSHKQVRADEGCLSVRDVYGTTLRHERVTIRAQRHDGSRFTRGSSGLLAQIFEHEIDHLNGILFTDHAKNVVHITHEHPA